MIVTFVTVGLMGTWQPGSRGAIRQPGTAEVRVDSDDGDDGDVELRAYSAEGYLMRWVSRGIV
jgi:hypothetical protein